MLSLLKSIILDFQEMDLQTGVPRKLKIETLPGKATICTGVRRSGKSTYMFQILKGLIEKGISRKNILYINFFDERLHDLHRQGLHLVLEAYYSLYPEKKNSEKIYCFFDEIQIIPNWESFVDRVLRSEKCEVYITGSSAHMLVKEIATQMRGRAISYELFPFSFQEFLIYNNIDSRPPYPTKKRLLIQKAFEDYWEVGGFPEVLQAGRSLRIKVHQEYFNSVLFRDLIERYDIGHPKSIDDLGHWFIDNASSLYSINKLTKHFKSLGYKISKTTLSNYVDWFEDAYFFFTVRLFDGSLVRSNINPKKIYCVDHSLVTSISSGILVNSGHLFENLVFLALRRISDAIFYYKTKSGKEVDFLLQNHNRTRLLVQVCESLSNEKTRDRELAALQEAMRELKLKRTILVTKSEESILTLEEGTIEILPAWRFLLLTEEGFD